MEMKVGVIELIVCRCGWLELEDSDRFGWIDDVLDVVDWKWENHQSPVVVFIPLHFCYGKYVMDKDDVLIVYNSRYLDATKNDILDFQGEGKESMKINNKKNFSSVVMIRIDRKKIIM